MWQMDIKILTTTPFNSNGLVHFISRWGISTHGGINGSSRLIVFIKADKDNRASKVLQHFIKTCLQLGVPSRVRSDHGEKISW